MRVQPRQFKLNRLPQKMAPRLAGATDISPTLKFIALVIFLPEELSFYIFQFRLTMIRLVLFILTPVLLFHLSKLVATGRRRLIFSDILIVLTGIWMIVSPTVVFNLGYSLNHSGPEAAEFCGSYFAGRVLLSESGQTLKFVNLMCHVIAIVALFGILDVSTSTPFTHDLLGQLTGYATVNNGGGFRLGIYRATGPIGHPILYGIVCAIGLLLAVSSPIRSKALTICACGLGVLLSLSSAPIEGTILGLGLLTYNRVLARFRGRWLLLIGIVALGIGTSFIFSASPLAAVLGRINIDAASYWVRMYQWETVGIIVRNSPWFGIGFDFYDVARQLPFFVFQSIDSLWLWLAVVYGIPGAILVGLSMVSTAFYPTSGRHLYLTAEESKLATTLSIIICIVVLLGFTVHFWEESWMLVGLLVGVRANLADPGSQRSSTPTKATPRGRPVFVTSIGP